MEKTRGNGKSQVQVKEEPEWYTAEDPIKIELKEEPLWERASTESRDARHTDEDSTLEDHDLNEPLMKQERTNSDTTSQQSAGHTGETGDLSVTDTDRHVTDDPYNCDTCGKTFEQKHDLIQHIKKAATECIPLENYTYIEIRRQKKPSRNKAFWCEICKKQFRDSSDIARHRRVHTGEKPYACDSCDKRFAQLNVLTRHKLTHTDKKPFKCEVCDKRFRGSSDLGKHRRIHADSKRLSCEICKKEVGDANDLANHRKIHKGEKPYSCEICKKQFAVLSYLKKHEKRIHS